MTTVSSIDPIFRNIGDEIVKFSASNMTFPTYEVLSTYDNDKLKAEIIQYRNSRFTVVPLPISTTYPNIDTDVETIINAYNLPTLPTLPQSTVSFNTANNNIKILINDILIRYGYDKPDVRNKLKEYTLDALFPKLNTTSGYSNHIREKGRFTNKNITFGDLYQYINIDGSIHKRASRDTESRIILDVLNKQPPKQQSLPLPQLQLFSFLFYNKDTDTGLSFILSTVEPKNITFDIIKNAIINYLATYEYFYKVYLHTKTTNSLFFQVIDKKQEKLNKYETQFTYTQQLTNNFFAITAYNNNGKKVEGQRVHIAITNDYLNYKFCLGNNSSSGFGNINHPYNKPSLSTFTLNPPTISTYNLNERAFKCSFNDFIENLIRLMTERTNVQKWINKTPINCFQEVNINSFKESIKSITSPGKKKARTVQSSKRGGTKGLDSPTQLTGKRQSSRQAAQAAQAAQAQAPQAQAPQAQAPQAQAADQSVVVENVIIEIDKELKKYKESTNIKKFIETNDIIVNDDEYSIPVYKNIFNDKNGVLISNRLANFDTNEKIKKGNLTCIDNEIEKGHIFIGKIGSGYQNNNIHTFIAIKKKYLDPTNQTKYNIIINLHLDTDDSKRVKQLELIYLLKYIIPKYEFFTDDNVEKIYIIGDLNMDCYEIITSIRERVNNKYYKDRRFKVVLNNIITQVSMNTKVITVGKGSALDNCIIIEKIPIQSGRSKCGEYKPQIYISESEKMPTPPKKSELKLSDHSLKLSDHSLIIIQDTTPDVVSTNKSMKSESSESSKSKISKAESIFSSIPKKH